jgi:outer membrane protein OmpA-like peptidoglycan-associated protein
MTSQLASNFKALLRGLVLVLLLAAGLWLMDQVAQTTIAARSAGAAHRADAASPASPAPPQAMQQQTAPSTTTAVPLSPTEESKAAEQSATQAASPPSVAQPSDGRSAGLSKAEPVRPATAGQAKESIREISTTLPGDQPARGAKEPPLGGSGLRIVSRADGRFITTEPILFSTAQAAIRPGSLPILAKLAELLKAQPGITLMIIGHTDNLGLDENNARVSRERASAVKDYLVGEGIDASRLEYKGMGSQNPIASNDTQLGRQANRRIEFLITSSK